MRGTKAITLWMLTLTVLLQSRLLPPPPPAMAMPAEPKAAGGNKLADVMEKQLLKFIECNYPSRMNVAVRSLQSEEGFLRKDLNEAIRFVQGFSRGSVTIEGNWQGSGRGRRYALQSVFRGVQGYPEATVTFHTNAGFFRPYTVVEVDKDGDGKVDEISTALCKRGKMLDWLKKKFPLAFST